MKRSALWQLLGLAFLLILSGCARVRHYTVVKDRIDQNLTAGNQGYLAGTAPQVQGERKTTRATYVTEVELPPWKKSAELKQKQQTKKPALSESIETEALVSEDDSAAQKSGGISESVPENLEKYTVQKSDTLQKISKKFYGTTKKWQKIFEANKDTLKGPNDIYPGQIINVPVQKLKEPAENLK